MVRIRKLEIENFRGIKKLAWRPSPGLNCLIGRGDAGKSTVLDAIEICLSGRRNFYFGDSDFHNLDVKSPIRIVVTFGELDDALKNFDVYGPYLRGYDQETGRLEDEPGKGLESVLSVLLKVESDLEPQWTLISERATRQGHAKSLSWGDRNRLAPTRLGTYAYHHLGWGRGSILNRVSEERADASVVLADAARVARTAFENDTKTQLSATLQSVSETARELGIPVGDSVRAMLEAHTASFTGGTISLHDAGGVPLSNLGAGSARLLVAGLQRRVSAKSKVTLIDEIEHGLEPHRIIRLLDSLGAKEKSPPLQVFMSTHSPAAVRELRGGQLFVVRRTGGALEVIEVGEDDAIQGTVRSFPDALLSDSIIVCEGASEVGFLRGLDQFRQSKGEKSIAASGVVLIDAGGATRIYRRAIALQGLRYRVAILRDDDVRPTPDLEAEFKDAGGTVIAWRSRRSLEDELFLSLGGTAIAQLLNCAVELHGEESVHKQIESASLGHLSLEKCRGALTPEIRSVLGKASQAKGNSWFKTVSLMEMVSREIIAPHLMEAEEGFRSLVEDVLDWAHGNEG